MRSLFGASLFSEPVRNLIIVTHIPQIIAVTCERTTIEILLLDRIGFPKET